MISHENYFQVLIYRSKESALLSLKESDINFKNGKIREIASKSAVYMLVSN